MSEAPPFSKNKTCFLDIEKCYDSVYFFQEKIGGGIFKSWNKILKPVIMNLDYFSFK